MMYSEFSTLHVDAYTAEWQTCKKTPLDYYYYYYYYGNNLKKSSSLNIDCISQQECHTSGCSIYKYGCMKGYTRTELPCYANEERMGLSGLRKDNGPFLFKRMYKIKCCKKSTPPPFIPPYRRYPRKDGEVEPWIDVNCE